MLGRNSVTSAFSEGTEKCVSEMSNRGSPGLCWRVPGRQPCPSCCWSLPYPTAGVLGFALKHSHSYKPAETPEKASYVHCVSHWFECPRAPGVLKLGKVMESQENVATEAPGVV